MPDFPTHNISEPDEDSASYGMKSFSLHQAEMLVFTYVPPEINEISPLALFELFLTESIVNDICKSSDEYTELMKDKLHCMYRHIQK